MTNTRNTTTYGASRMNPQVCQGDRRLRPGPEGTAGSICGSASVDMKKNGAAAPPRVCQKFYPATSLMRAINSSTALSTGTFSLTTRFIALAQTFSLFRMVNFQFLVKSNGAVPPLNWL